MIYEQSNTPVDPGVLERVMDRLSHRGPDGRDAKVNGHVAMGHWHFWTTPEEVGEQQPLEVEGLPFTIVLDGRLDNRDELMPQLGLKNPEDEHLSDAALIIHAYDRWGARCFEHFVGEYAVVIFDVHHGELICARDALGDRTLFYSIKGTRLVIASEPWSVAGADNSPVELDERAAAYFFALRATEDGQTLFRNIFELLPAHVMIHSSSGFRTWRYWQPDPSIRLRGKSDMEYAEEFRSLLEESVRCRMRSTTPVGVLMSGGLDSTSVACLAARIIAPKQLTTFSYVFDELTDCDERKYIEMVKEYWQIHSIEIPCDDTWPYKEWEDWAVNPNYPDDNVYGLLKYRVYRRIHDEGVNIFLSGSFGDDLYYGGVEWLADFIADGKLRLAKRELQRHIKYSGIRKTLRSDYLRRAGNRPFNYLKKLLKMPNIRNDPEWLTDYSKRYLKKEENWLLPDFYNKINLLGLNASRESSYENFKVSRHGLELRHPYRDRRLIEYMLSLPGYLSHNFGYHKYILRVAMQGILPQPIISRTQPTYLFPLLSRGLQREHESLVNCFTDPNAAWRKFVRLHWINEHWQNEITPQTDNLSSLIPWLCISFDAWVNKMILVEY